MVTSDSRLDVAETWRSWPNRQRVVLCFVLSLVHIFSSSSYAQTLPDSSRTPLWLTVGLGPGTVGGLSGNAGLGGQLGTTTYSVRGSVNTDGILGDGFNEVAVLIGYGRVKKNYHFSFGIGIARVSGSRVHISVEAGVLT